MSSIVLTNNSALDLAVSCNKQNGMTHDYLLLVLSGAISGITKALFTCTEILPTHCTVQELKWSDISLAINILLLSGRTAVPLLLIKLNI